ncbi:AMP-dependent synthetase [Reichenbachiella sp. 5M10]|uniref:AMP-dependent synthetase/ligase n=1 Tax=Reichenbachiella sp. 5M10 TaxID=1889772 RepID=UPI000C155F6E|nr:AMP-dependent synthetase/ligase [Reichenbachiella sp. 5M10]PIB36705.1 AMP-dependent synthetase [Reichenbachiella sp. 5M10]
MNSPTRVFDFLHYQLATHPLEVCLSQKEQGNWRAYSTGEVLDISAKLSLGLLKLGVGPGDKVAIISPNRAEWNFVDQACSEIGAVSVPMYPTITVEDYRYIFEHAEVKVVFAADQELVGKVQEASKTTSVQHIYSFEDVEECPNWKQVLSLDPNGDCARVEQIKSTIRPEDLFTIIYTSGTTGKPKGVMLSHDNVVSNARAVKVALRELFDHGGSALSFLPLCHILERTAISFYFFRSVSIYYAESMDTLADNLKEVKPLMFTTVPRLLEKVYDRIVAKGYELSWVKRKLFFWAVRLGLKFEPYAYQGVWYTVQLKIARRLIFTKWIEALGGNLSYVLVGAAALQPRLARVFWAAGIPVCEGYGLTETSPGIAFNVPFEGGVRVGTVGRVLDRIQVKIAEDGEILCQGPNVMLGYYKAPELTAEIIQEGWLHTGDIGELEDNFLKITDRKKEMFKTSGGKYIAPQRMENRFKESPFIEQIMVIGEGQKFPAAIIVPNVLALTDWCTHHGVVFSRTSELLKHPQVATLIQSQIDKYNTGFGHWEQVKKYELVEDEWGVDTGELTPTLKLKRRVIKTRYAELIRKIYES